ncbi:hypothetical protein CPB86DRAFT_790670 [Serendipita vermifera]|nr:hypothetical protein CPB86DRAFT_790670 [Serendipita vermifera]
MASASKTRPVVIVMSKANWAYLSLETWQECEPSMVNWTFGGEKSRRSLVCIHRQQRWTVIVPSQGFVAGEARESS